MYLCDLSENELEKKFNDVRKAVFSKHYSMFGWINYFDADDDIQDILDRLRRKKWNKEIREWDKYINSIVNNVIISKIRKRNTRYKHKEKVKEIYNEYLEGTYIGRQLLLSDIEKILTKTLTKDEVKLYFMKYYYGYKNKEIAEELKIKISTVYYRLRIIQNKINRRLSF